MQATLEAINQMQADRVIGRYAIGGALGATFYLEPAATLDLNILATLPAASGGYLLRLAPIYEYLKSPGGKIEDEYIVIGGWPVQWLAPSNDLETEVVAEAVATTVGGVPTWVMSPNPWSRSPSEPAGPKDHTPILPFVEQGAVNRKALQSILERTGAGREVAAV